MKKSVFTCEACADSKCILEVSVPDNVQIDTPFYCPCGIVGYQETKWYRATDHVDGERITGGKRGNKKVKYER